MNKRGITKFWIEIIGGVIVVVVILVIFIAVASTIGTAATDVENSQEMNALVGGFSEVLAKAKIGGGEHTISPFVYRGPGGSQVYAMVLVTPAGAAKMVGPPPDGLGKVLASKNKQEDLYKLQKCVTEGDLCMCLIRFKYGCNLLVPDPFNMLSGCCMFFPENLIVTSPNKGGYRANNPSVSEEEGLWWDDFGSIDEWNLNKLVKLDTAVTDMVVVDCKLLSSESSCSTIFGENNIKACIPHYKDKPMVWLSTKKDEPLHIETLKLDTFAYGPNLLSYYPYIKAFEFMPGAPRTISQSTNTKPCVTCGGC
jgi:hypothetical protein